jgi:VWFA-related protein
MHLQFQATPRVRDLFQRVAKTLLHDGDMFGIVSSGPSSIAIDMTYDKRRMDDAIKKMTGAALKPSELIETASGPGGPSELRYRAHVAFSTMADALNNLEKVHDRRKALVWVSEGYDFNPFQNSRLGLGGPDSPFLQNRQQQMLNDGNRADSINDPQRQSEIFSDADLASELGEITRAANRANATIYTIDPRGLVAGGDIAEEVDPREWAEYVRKSQDTLRVIAEETGGLAVVNQNDFDKALKRIDAESSDYYVLGYYSSNPDPTVRRRKIEVRVPKQRSNLTYRTEYVLKPPPRPVSTARP